MKIAILLCGLMTGISQVEHIILLLRVQHQCVLVGSLHGAHQLLYQSFGAIPACCRTSVQFVVVLLQFSTQNTQRLFQILLLQYRASLGNDGQCEYTKYQ